MTRSEIFTGGIGGQLHGGIIVGYEPINTPASIARDALQQQKWMESSLRNELAALARAASYMTPIQLQRYIRKRPLLNGRRPAY